VKARPGDHWARALVSEDPIRLRPAKLREVRLHSLAVRFAFGAAVSLLAGLVTVLFGPRAGGVWLAFPAILPAGLTLIERREGRREADRGVRGSVLGAIGMVAFAVTVYVMVPLAGRLAALLAALLVWLVVTLGLYLGLRALLRRRATPRR
jgi:predicted membrane protein